MPQSLAKVYIHVDFSTKDRRPAIGDEWRDALLGSLAPRRRISAVNRSSRAAWRITSTCCFSCREHCRCRTRLAE